MLCGMKMFASRSRRKKRSQVNPCMWKPGQTHLLLHCDMESMTMRGKVFSLKWKQNRFNELSTGHSDGSTHGSSNEAKQ